MLAYLAPPGDLLALSTALRSIDHINQDPDGRFPGSLLALTGHNVLLAEIRILLSLS